jgi:2,3,4,5-tetrahydropyridine-2-carboxylate N-succinyltransferase
MSDLETRIVQWYDDVASMTPENLEARRDVELVITKLDDGQLRVAEIDTNGDVVVHEWVKKAILLLFRLRDMEKMDVGPFEYLDKLELKHDYERRGVRVVPGASARRGSFLSPGVILMPSFVNIGAWVGANTMVDTWATVGSCAQIGANVHLSGGVGIGGVLEPANAVPVVIEDNAFIGSRCMIVDGARVGQGAVLGAGTILNPTIPVIDAQTGEEVSRGYVPDYCVAVSANRRRELPGGEFFLPCVLILRRMSEGERHNKVALNDLLREHGVAT